MKRNCALLIVTVISSIISLSIAPSAFANSSAPTMNDSSLKRHDISVKVNFEPGQLSVKDYKASAAVGTKKDSTFGSGAAGKVEFDTKGIFPYQPSNDRESFGFGLSPNFKYEAATGKVNGKNEIVKQDLTLGKVAVLDWRYQNGYSSPAGEFLSQNEAEKDSQNRKADTGFTYKVVVSGEGVCQAPGESNGGSQPAGCKAGTKFPIYSVAKQPNAAVSVEGLVGEGIAHQSKALGTSGYGAKLSVAKINHQVDFKLNGLPMDFCLNAAAGALVGTTKILGRDHAVIAHGEAGACLGVKVGQLGRLGYEIQLAGDYTNHGGFEKDGLKYGGWDDGRGSIHQTASYKKQIGPTEIGASFTHSIEGAHNGFTGETRKVVTDMFMVGIGN